MNPSKLSTFKSDSISKSPVKAFERLRKLSKPKLRTEDEDLVGPASYYPKDSYLSTNSKSPRPALCKSTRFAKQKLPPLYLIDRKSSNEYTLANKTSLANSPSFSFKRTGHNLQLVENPSFPGAGQYSPVRRLSEKFCSFSKAPRNFSWKKISIDKTKFNKFDLLLDYE